MRKILSVLSGLDLAHLQPLIQVTFEGDSGRASPELRASRANGPHAKLAKLKETTTDDDEVFHHMVIWLRRHFGQSTGDADWTKQKKLCGQNRKCIWIDLAKAPDFIRELAEAVRLTRSRGH